MSADRARQAPDQDPEAQSPRGTVAAVQCAPEMASDEAAPTSSERERPACVVGTRTDLLDEAVIAELDDLDGLLLSDLLDYYFDEVATHVVQLSRTIDGDEGVLAAQIAHKIKGNSASIGAPYVAQIASELEVAANAGALRLADDLLDKLGFGLDWTRDAFRDRMRTPA